MYIPVLVNEFNILFGLSQESSLRHTEELARELEYLKAQKALAYKS